ncbi:MAG: hypothetical protein ACLQED_14690, partial [Desulfobaccales bacterium]
MLYSYSPGEDRATLESDLSADGEVIDQKARMIKDHVDAINVTDNQTSVCRMCSLVCCIRIKLLGLEPILQMTTRDR